MDDVTPTSGRPAHDLPPRLCSIRLEHLQSFVALADELHFARAAKRLNVTPSGLSRRIAFLERAVGSPLVARSTHRVELTRSGRLLHPFATELLAQVAQWPSSVRPDGVDGPRHAVAVRNPDGRSARWCGVP